MTSDPAVDGLALWSPDGSQIVFSSARKGPDTLNLYTIPASGTGRVDLLQEMPGYGAATDWSYNGQFLLYHCRRPTTGYDLWALPIDGKKEPFRVVSSTFKLLNGQFSPDGKWVAYQSDESGRFEIYVQPFPGPGDKKQVSTTGGGQVRWRSNGKELFYIALDGYLMAVPIQLPSNRGAVDIGQPVRLFQTHIRYGSGAEWGAQYAVARDGQRFLLNTVMEETHTISVILNLKPIR